MKTMWDEKNKKWVNVPDHWVGHPEFGGGFSDGPTAESEEKVDKVSRAGKGHKEEGAKNA